jgi:CRP-like cAMP-binding protein
MPSERFRNLAQEVPLFKGFTEEDVAKIFGKCNTMHVKKGDVIFYEGTSGNQMYIILGGKVLLLSGKKQLAMLSKGDMLGEMALISEEPRSATATASEDSSLFVLSETVFDKLLSKRVAVRMLLNIIGTMSKRLRETNAALTRNRDKYALAREQYVLLQEKYKALKGGHDEPAEPAAAAEPAELGAPDDTDDSMELPKPI